MADSYPDLEAMIARGAQFDWSSWQPEPGDFELIERPSDGKPPLTGWIFQQLLDFEAWVQGRELTAQEITWQRDRVVQAWQNAWSTGDLLGVQVAWIDIALWAQIQSLPQGQQDLVRQQVWQRRQAAAAQPTPETISPQEVERQLREKAMTGKLITDLTSPYGPRPPGFF